MQENEGHRLSGVEFLEIFVMKVPNDANIAALMARITLNERGQGLLSVNLNRYKLNRSKKSFQTILNSCQRTEQLSLLRHT